MRPSLLYRVAAVLLALFAAGHTAGFREVDPQWGIDAVINGMKASSFQVLGMQRTYWDFFVGLGLFVSVLQLFAALVAWQLATLDPPILARMGLIRWGFVVAFVGLSGLSWRYFFPIPLLFSVAIALCLVLAAWSGDGRRGAESSRPYGG
jgi:hypothetical protein